MISVFSAKGEKLVALREMEAIISVIHVRMNK
jgi:hypothetical protein